MTLNNRTSSEAEFTLGALRLSAGRDAWLNLSHPALAESLTIQGPTFEVNGIPRSNFRFIDISQPNARSNGGVEVTLRYLASGLPNLLLRMVLRGYPQSPIVRMKYQLSAESLAALTKHEGVEHIRYLRLQIPGLFRLTEFQLSHFDQVVHSYMPNREERTPEQVLPGLTFSGPLAVFHDSSRTLMLAYEHGSDHPSSFLQFVVGAEGEVSLEAVKGNSYDGQPLHEGLGWESVWFELGLLPGGLENFMPVYRKFMLEEICENDESRRPFVYYNTWYYQEQQKYLKGMAYLSAMQAEQILPEIDVAHQLGIDIFHIDTGWFSKTGDWLVDYARFPEGLHEVRRKLKGYGMKMGLWLNPSVAALTSRIYQEHPEYEMTWDGVPRSRRKIWETEMSTQMCIVSDYADFVIDFMVRLHEELGTSFFVWDAVDQRGCNSPLHHHGTQGNSPEERADCFEYEVGKTLIHVAEEVTRRCPEVIINYDITEYGRFVGLGMLSAGNYWLNYCGPYFRELDIPTTVKIEPNTASVFFWPGPAHPRICRQGVKYDPLIPAILFQSHFFVDPPRLSQQNNLAAMMLGGNGLSGDLLALTSEDIEYLAEQIGLYKRVAHGVNHAYPIQRGFQGSSPEVHEKIDPERAAGVVIFFTVSPGTVSHYTQPLPLEHIERVEGADAWEEAPGGRLKLTVTLERDDARIVYILPKDR